MNFHLKFLFQLILCLVALVSSLKKQANTSPESKLQQITDLAAKAKGNVITLDDSTFSYYAVTKPKPYSLVVFLTAAHPKFKCGICKQIDNELVLLASSYKSSLKENETPSVFFIRLDYESSQRVFMSYGVQSVPLLFHLGPNTAVTKTDQDYEILPRDRYQVPADPTAESLSSFLSDRTGISVKIERSMIGSYILIIVFFLIIAALVRPVINSLPFWLRLIQWKTPWMLLSYGIYTCAISGLIFDIIRSPAMYYANPQTGQIMFFYPQSGNQFVVEGFCIGFLNLACAISALLVVYAPYFKDQQYRTFGILGGIFVFFFCFRMVRNLYIMKNQWYGSRF